VVEGEVEADVEAEREAGVEADPALAVSVARCYAYDRSDGPFIPSAPTDNSNNVLLRGPACLITATWLSLQEPAA